MNDMISLTPDAINQFLHTKGYKSTIQQETQQVYCQLTIAQKPYPLFFRVFDGQQLLQLMLFFPFVLEKTTLPDMARLLHLLNKELDMPGFGMDETKEVVFYRVVLPAPSKKIEGISIITFIESIEKICATFSDPIQAIGAGLLSLDDILERSKKAAKEGTK